jgi:hypothetical protein
LRERPQVHVVWCCQLAAGHGGGNKNLKLYFIFKNLTI